MPENPKHEEKNHLRVTIDLKEQVEVNEICSHVSRKQTYEVTAS